jgi:hypothetical protein
MSKPNVVVLVFASWLLVSGAVACSSAVGASPDTGGDAALPDGGAPDAGGGDAPDAGEGDAGDAATLPDSPSGDAGPNGSADAGTDAPVDPGQPSLVALSVSSQPSADGSPPVVLVPAFSPGVHDYSVRCTEGQNALTISMTAASGSSSLLVQPVPSPALPQQTLSANVTENQAIVAAATNGDATVEYWVRCLPHDFPLLQWTAHPSVGTPHPGYYLMGTGVFLGSGGIPVPPTSGCFAMVLDRNGVPVWYAREQWAHGFCVFDVDSVVPGTISFDSIIDAPSQFEVHALGPLATTTVAPKVDGGTPNVDLHELRVLPNGNYLVISSPPQPGVDLTGMQVPLPTGGVETLSGPQTILACDLVELQPDGTEVWTWTATDHFDAVKDSIVPTLTSAGPFGNNLVDPFHCNSIDVDPGNGNLLVSAREMNSIFYIEKATGRVLWKMGGATASKDGAAYVAVADPFALQHDARLQPDWSPTCDGGSGHISMFDDEVPGAALPARAVVYDVAVGGGDVGCGDAGSAAGTATVSWQRPGQGPTPAMGSFRILPDGSRVIGWGLVPGQGFTEVDEHGKDLADLSFADGNVTYRAIKVPLGALDLGILRSTAGLP